MKTKQYSFINKRKIMEFNLNKSYNFNTKSPEILGDRFNNMKVLGYMTHGMAIKYRDVKTLNRQIGEKTNYEALSYILFSSNDTGVEHVFAIEWLDTTSIVSVNNVDLELRISNITTDDMRLIILRLRELGFVAEVI